ncbi:cysteine-rich receptor-like protein kinase 44 isoform X1 [Lolium perenne]|uniref:cysteine-rich receptor-like protein kinase 44 isoform X1 n=1 Tax=Lolium perenne TaxID=4522 RepID=UPI0021F52E77|nr:cysteine-rich receptor-like protein kinase 44 isoform X1 [Lolium perenne]XP_051197742.1 cysteine-rich receptor-like protein kinase 44 isoform X1 [Lolium perenne]XP_051197743.1 cysteine-rich receptor-like protein kinase 44 isoform X1 [Lolium perenne]
MRSRIRSTVMSLDSLEELTNGFSKELGRGSFGVVYEGEYPDGRKIAVKMLHAAYGIRAEKFQDELKIMTKLRHKNIVRLVGYCHHTQQVPIMHEGKLVVANKISMALCLEHMHNGSLHELISGGRHKYDWQTCYGIITGICKGLNYLHNELKPPIFHLDLKPANVLLDDKMIPRIADFGISRILGEDEHTRVTKSVLGTLGYSPPEFMDHRIISNKFDIFSLGVVIIKMMAGPDGHSESTEMSSDEFTKLVQEYWTSGIIEPLHQRKAHSEQVKACIEFGLRCVKKDRRARPTILDIVGILEETETNRTDAARKEWSSISKTMQLQDRPQENDLSQTVEGKRSVSHASESSSPRKLARKIDSKMV